MEWNDLQLYYNSSLAATIMNIVKHLDEKKDPKWVMDIQEVQSKFTSALLDRTDLYVQVYTFPNDNDLRMRLQDIDAELDGYMSKLSRIKMDLQAEITRMKISTEIQSERIQQSKQTIAKLEAVQSGQDAQTRGADIMLDDQIEKYNALFWQTVRIFVLGVGVSMIP
jgi:hypothetical protein